VSSLTSVYLRMRSSIQVYHAHDLNYLDELEADARKRASPQITLQTLKQYRALRRKIDGDPRKKWKVISLVREPVARNVAWFFHSLDDLLPGWREQWRSGALSLESLQELFLDAKRVDHKAPENWFADQMLPVFCIDVFAEPFPKDLGYKTYEGTRASLLLIRMEDLTACGPGAISRFLGLEDFKLINSNMGDDKEYADAYRAFRRLPLPKSYVEEMYATKFANHFYTGQEIERFTRMWTALKTG
jgi:hypothetical protein